MRTGGAAPASEFNINSPNHPERGLEGAGNAAGGPRRPAARRCVQWDGPDTSGPRGARRARRGRRGARAGRTRRPRACYRGGRAQRPERESARHGGGTRREERSQRTETGNRRKHIIIPNALAPRRALAEPYRRRSRSKEMQRRASRVCVAEIHSRAAPRHRSPMLLLHPQGDRANISALLPSPLFSRPHE